MFGCNTVSMGKPGWEGWVATTHQQYAKIRGEDLDTVLFSAEKEIKKYIDTWTPPAATQLNLYLHFLYQFSTAPL